MPDVKILLLCNNKIAIPALKELLFFNHAAGVVIPSKNKELVEIITELSKDYKVPVVTVDRNNFKKIIKHEIEKNKVQAVLIMTFPFLIPRELLSLPPKGFINFHYGKLPQYRGPEPIFTQILLQEKNPGLTVHIVTEGVDNGPVILQESLPYNPQDTYGQLQHKLADTGAKLLTVLLKILSFGSILPSQAQDETQAAYHKNPTAKTLMIDWQTMDSFAIQALVNACNPWNKGCGAAINDMVIGITEVEILEKKGDEKIQPGTIVKLNNEDGLQVHCCDGNIIKITIFYTESGFMSGKKLANIGIAAGTVFKTL